MHSSESLRTDTKFSYRGILRVQHPDVYYRLCAYVSSIMKKPFVPIQGTEYPGSHHDAPTPMGRIFCIENLESFASKEAILHWRPHFVSLCKFYLWFHISGDSVIPIH